MSFTREKAIKYLAEAVFKANLHSKDPNTKVACLLISPEDGVVLSTGYNGFPRLFPDTKEHWERPTKYLYVRHAERNAIDNAARKGVSVEGCVAVVNKFPCKDCAGSLAQVGCTDVYTFDLLDDPDFATRYADENELTEYIFENTKVRLHRIRVQELKDMGLA